MSTLLQFIKDVKLDFTQAFFSESSGQELNYTNFEIAPKDFLRFAKLDFAENDNRGFINSLTNSKRAIDCQIEEVLTSLSLNAGRENKHIEKFINQIYKDSDTHYNLKIIHSLNLAPTILISKTRNIRNKLEHFYQYPTNSEVQEALNITELFIKTINGQFRNLLGEFTLSDEKNYNYKKKWNTINGLGFRVTANLNNLHFEVLKIINSSIVDRIIINNQNFEFLYLLRLIFSTGDYFELTNSIKLMLEAIKHPVPLKHVM
ncbi:hypothetical protein [Epilithonimonas hispanica]|uniref:Uncharacterized protein n=1 Tax=Epilithonimonas hispanica TaxID=358687 RepID=A0A3D9CVW3_9FLAO|nr:hypothetical protein [Epilithonimonas hispanica]REC69892.1 hypothetical protein DRF58_11350 [Epilithonimonas hispanica]